MKPAVPGLLGLPRDYLNGQLGAWQTRQRHATAPDCMATIAETDDAGDRRYLHLAVVAAGAGGFPARIGACRTTADDLRQHPAMKMPVRIVVAALLLAFALMAAVWVLELRHQEKVAGANDPFTPTAQQIERGEYLARAG